MATGVGCGGIRLASSNSLPPRSLMKRKGRGDISFTSLVIAHFVSKLAAMVMRVGQGENRRKWEKEGKAASQQ